MVVTSCLGQMGLHFSGLTYLMWQNGHFGCSRENIALIHSNTLYYGTVAWCYWYATVMMVLSIVGTSQVILAR